ncbi:MAG: 50S ribosomal protein L22 [Candidatus Gracilibacteria bacterium]
MKAILRQIRIAPKKANLVAALARNHKAVEAVQILKFTPKRGAKILKKVIESAMANAKSNFKQNVNDLFIKEIIVTEGTTYKRSMPVSRGRSHPIMKRTSHITVKLGIHGSEAAALPGSPDESTKLPKKTKK